MWFLWILTAWAIPLIIHISSFILYKKGILNLATVIILYHTICYFVINAFLAFTNWFTNNFTIIWFGWSLGGWGAGLIVHYVIYLYIVPRKEQKGTSKSWYQREIEREMQKIKKNRNE